MKIFFHSTFSMTKSLQKILILIKSKKIKSHTKIILFIKLDMGRSETLANQKLIV